MFKKISFIGILNNFALHFLFDLIRFDVIPNKQDEEYAASLADRQKVARAEGFENDSLKADDHDFDSTLEPIPSTIEELRMVRLKYFEKRSY